MTRDTHRRSSDAQDPIEAEIFVGLWEHAAFPRLPRDAPSVLEDLVEDVENPKRVYTIHRASRRHNFQLLVQKYALQHDEREDDSSISGKPRQRRRRPVPDSSFAQDPSGCSEFFDILKGLESTSSPYPVEAARKLRFWFDGSVNKASEEM
ncbi:hypothetical protein MCOR23_006395 [Pyricularia oryzae]|nr:hypothetical protein MCOR23_006395 [Pyricularia oryzae]KAI6400683.1 hypothetical protein MCOR20_008373 [Pyricularia oryzae]KAI6524237.1 hypothetical protein MCOR16_006977 [Pyricularia oryzae]KAI6592673.1 hypothetical protein MCOR06_004103 [Pyricularia oryzae]KAI6628798.1 hypothetical protein MCOR08_006624 [Pyricularia oryzae]